MSILKGFSPLVFVSLSLAACQSRLADGPRPELENIDYILVNKSQGTIAVYNNGTELEKYKVAMGRSPVGHKQKEGDCKTPEGIYEISHKNPNSQYYKALTISYPNKQDREFAKRLGVSPGGGIQIHGYNEQYNWIQQSHTVNSSTRGCILLTNHEMKQIFDATKVGTKIEIIP